MKTLHSTIPILDFCEGLIDGDFTVNKDYQRSDKVWPTNAKSFLIETILLEYPVPKLSIHQNLDLKSRKIVKQIVDGQQRSAAILDFFQNRLRLSRSLATEHFRGRTFSELEEVDQRTFLDYGLNFDIFAGATVDEVREVFRRMNSFTIPLNPEETRHATFQGDFKWFINSLSKRYDEALSAAGVFSPKQLNRMADAKLLTELSHALLNGITTTTKGALDGVYRKYDNEFDRPDIQGAVEYGLEQTLFSDAIQGTPLAKPLNFYALCLAEIHASGMVMVPGEFVIPAMPEFAVGDKLFNLSVLAEALEKDSTEERKRDELTAFLSAAKDRTNVASQRTTRFEYFLAAIQA